MVRQPRQVLEQIRFLSPQPLAAAIFHRGGAEIDASRRNAIFAHDVQEFAAAAPDIQHFPRALKVRYIKLLPRSYIFFRAAEAVRKRLIVEIRGGWLNRYRGGRRYCRHAALPDGP